MRQRIGGPIGVVALLAATVAVASVGPVQVGAAPASCDAIVWSGLDTGPVRQVFVADSDGMNRAEISSVTDIADPDPTNNQQPQWSPDGTRIVWRGADGAAGAQVFVADSDGMNRLEISSITDTADPDPSTNLAPQWSPDGIRIAWEGTTALDARCMWLIPTA